MKVLKLKRIRLFFLALTLSIIPFSSASAGTGEWDYIGEETVYKSGSSWDSGGGSWKVTSDPYNTVCVKYELWEYDPYDPDDYIGSRSVCPGGNDVFDVSGFTDGGGQAELYVKKTNYTGTPTRMIYHD